MVELTHVIKDPLGFHARLAMRLSDEAARWESRITVLHGLRIASASDVMALMGLEAMQGDTIDVRVEGPDEQDAAEFIAYTLRGM